MIIRLILNGERCIFHLSGRAGGGYGVVYNGRIVGRVAQTDGNGVAGGPFWTATTQAGAQATRTWLEQALAWLADPLTPTAGSAP